MPLVVTAKVVEKPDERLLWDRDIPIKIYDWVNRIHVKDLSLAEHTCITSLDPDEDLFANGVHQCEAHTYEITFIAFWYNKVERLLLRWIRRYRAEKLRRKQAIMMIEAAVLEWLYKPGGPGFRRACRDYNERQPMGA